MFNGEITVFMELKFQKSVQPFDGEELCLNTTKLKMFLPFCSSLYPTKQTKLL